MTRWEKQDRLADLLTSQAALIWARGKCRDAAGRKKISNRLWHLRRELRAVEGKKLTDVEWRSE